MRRTTTIALCGFAIGASAQMAAAADAVDFQLDPFYSAIGYGMSLSDENPELLDAAEEEGILAYLLENYVDWRSVRFELSLNPLPLVGVSIKSYARDFYNKMNVMPELNIVESLTEGFPDPGAAHARGAGCEHALSDNSGGLGRVAARRSDCDLARNGFHRV